MHQSVDKSFPEGAAIIVGDRNPKKPHLNLFFFDASLEEQFHLFEGFEQRLMVKLIDPDIGPLQNLKGHFVGRYMLPQKFLGSQQQESGDGRTTETIDLAAQTKRAVQLFIGQR